jgi:RNA polymerase sigma factor (sigma-70 family)
MSSRVKEEEYEVFVGKSALFFLPQGFIVKRRPERRARVSKYFASAESELPTCSVSADATACSSQRLACYTSISNQRTMFPTLSTAEERTHLTQLVQGTDGWPRFWQLFGRVILWELRRLNITDDALQQDIFQELVLKLLDDDYKVIRHFLQQPRSEPFTAYVRVMARHLAISLLRKRGREVPCDMAAQPCESSSPAAWAQDPARKYELEQSLAALLCHASNGDEKSAGFQIMYLRFVEQLSVNAVADRLRMKPNTVSQRIKYYLTRLRSEYALTLMELEHE